MRTRYGRPPWVESVPPARRPDHPRLRGEHASDVVIVGAGLTGCATALACALDGRRTLLLDAARLGQGSTSRGEGLLLPDPPVAARDLVRLHGRATARHMCEAWRRASTDAAAQLKRLNIACDLEALEQIDVEAWTDADMRHELAARAAAGLPAKLLTPATARRASAMEAVQGGLHLGRGFALDPYRACLGLAAAAARRGVHIAERSRVHQIRSGAKGVEITTEESRIQAGTVIVATALPTPMFTSLNRHFTEREAYVVLTEPLPRAMRHQATPAGVLVLDGRSPRRLVRATSDHRLCVTGADQDLTTAQRREAVLVQRTGQLMYELLVRYPAISGLRPAFGWDAPYGATRDGIQYVGAHRHYPRHLFALGGRETVTGAFLAAGILTRASRGEATRADTVFGWTR